MMAEDISQVVGKQLRSQKNEKQHPDGVTHKTGLPRPVIAISRQLGSGGAEIAKGVAKRLDCQVIGWSIVNEVAKRSEVREELLSALDEQAKIQVKSKNVLNALPTLKGLGKMGRHVDEVARTFKAMGKEETIRLIDKAGKETKIKSTNCGFLKALGAIKGKEWQFTKEELDYGDYLSEFTKALLNSEPENYKDAVQNLLTASGSGETVS